MKLLTAIRQAPWMIDAATLESHLPIALRLMKGEEVSFNQPVGQTGPIAVSTIRAGRFANYNDAPKGSIAVHQVIGTVTKFDQFCGPSGTLTLMRRMREADDHSNIGAHLIEIDSGGGEATNIETVARFIREELKKPVVAWFNGVAASAAYYIASAADEIYASEETDLVGSIGVLISFMDIRGWYEEMGVKLHEVYATPSTLKNIDFKEALEGKYEKLRTGLLDPYAKLFIATVKEFRPGLTEKDAYAGATFMAPKAIEIGMIDGIKSLQQAIDRASELGANKTANSNSINMTYQRIEAVLGHRIELQDGGAFLRAEELDRINRAIVAEGHEAVELTTLQQIQNSLAANGQTLGQIKTSVDNNATAIQTNKDTIAKLSAAPGAQPAQPMAEKDPDSGAAPTADATYQSGIDAMTEAAQSGRNPFSGS